MSLYVRVLTSFYTHRKTLRLRVALGNDAFWVPPRLWAYAAGNQPDGIFEDYTAEEIAMLIGYQGDAKAMLQALLHSAYMDENPLRIHDWEEHNSSLAFFERRAKQAAKARWDKEKERTKERESVPKSTIPNLTIPEPSIASSNASSMSIGVSSSGGGHEIILKEFSGHLQTPRVMNKWQIWMTHRRAFKKPKSWLILFNEQIEWLGKFDEPTVFEILSVSIRNGYQGLFEPRNNNEANRNTNSTGARNHRPTVADERNSKIIGAEQVRRRIIAEQEAGKDALPPGYKPIS